jgi:riboflavin synthase
MAIVYQYFMFTGIIEGTGIIKSLVKISENDKAADNRIEIDLGKLSKGLEIGDSVNVNGTCLTATRILKSVAFFEVVKETMKRTALGFLKVGDHVNLERSLRVNDRLEGHIVLGHVDGVGKIQEIKKDPSETKMWINVNKEISKYLVPKGSVALDGISFTIVDVSETKFSIALVPHTLAVTTFKNKQKGDKVNIEADILSKYVTKLLPRY